MDRLEITIHKAINENEVDCDENGIVHTRFGNEFDLIALIKFVIYEVIEKEIKVT